MVPCSAPKSEYDPNVAIHSVTGASADSIDELSAFAVMFFRTAYPFDASILSSPPGGSEGGGNLASLGAVSRAENVADMAVVQPRVIPHRAQVDSRPQGSGGERLYTLPPLPVAQISRLPLPFGFGQVLPLPLTGPLGPSNSKAQGSGGERQRQKPYQEPRLPVGPAAAVSHRQAHRQMGCFPSCGQPPGSLDHGQGRGTPRQQALHVARQRLSRVPIPSMQISRTDAEIYQTVRTLSLALGSAKTEIATIRALHAVLLTLDRPGMSKKEAYTSTGASSTNFKKWQRRVQHAQLDLPQLERSEARDKLNRLC